MPGIERPPTAAEEDFKPRAEVHRAWGHDHSDVAQISGGITSRNVQGSAERNREMLKVAADSDTLGINSQRGANRIGKLVAKRDLAVHPIAYGFHSFPSSWGIPK